MNSNPRRTGNNFTFIRLCFCILVVIAHSYTLSGKALYDWIQELTDGQAFTAWLCFKCFFVISGFLIFQSLMASKSIPVFLWKRALRIYPALFVVLIFTVLYGQFLYQNDVPYLQNKEVLSYIPNNLLLVNIQYSIQGIFDHNPYKSAINGSLWSLPYEAVFYLLLCAFFMLKKNIQISRITLLTVFAILCIGNIYYSEVAWNFRFFKLIGTYLLDLGAFFTAGALLGSLEFENFRYKNAAMGIGFILLLFSFYFSCFKEFQYISLPLIIIPLGTASTRLIRDIDKVLGDISYGVYIYSFPIQQALVYYFKLDYIELMITSLIISLFLGYLSWHLIEKRAMRFKKITFPRTFSSKANNTDLEDLQLKQASGL